MYPSQPLSITSDALVAIIDTLDAVIDETTAPVLGDPRVIDAVMSLSTTLTRVLARADPVMGVASP